MNWDHDFVLRIAFMYNCKMFNITALKYWRLILSNEESVYVIDVLIGYSQEMCILKKIFYTYGGFQLVMGVPQVRWRVYFMENPNLKLGSSWGYPNFRKPPYQWPQHLKQKVLAARFTRFTWSKPCDTKMNTDHVVAPSKNHRSYWNGIQIGGIY